MEDVTRIKKITDFQYRVRNSLDTKNIPYILGKPTKEYDFLASIKEEEKEGIALIECKIFPEATQTRRLEEWLSKTQELRSSGNILKSFYLIEQEKYLWKNSAIGVEKIEMMSMNQFLDMNIVQGNKSLLNKYK